MGECQILEYSGSTSSNTLRVRITLRGKMAFNHGPQNTACMLCAHISENMNTVLCSSNWKGSKGQLVTYVRLLAGKKTQFLKVSLWMLW